ncbi:MAG: DUF721 domain-containing protein [Dysgonamonadaceae bacterium]|jgi:hypothetical protein|nr:DUF721 domain-containing protein [Dysgonamonadaceae bacterium]
MKRTPSQSIGQLLETFFDSHPQMADRLAEYRLTEQWKAMNPAVSRYTAGLFVKNRVLYVKIQSSVLKSELMMYREQLVARLNREVNRDVIDDIVFT